VGEKSDVTRMVMEPEPVGVVRTRKVSGTVAWYVVNGVLPRVSATEPGAVSVMAGDKVAFSACVVDPVSPKPLRTGKTATINQINQGLRGMWELSIRKCRIALFQKHAQDYLGY
jgi:hypothetical protein